MKITTPRVGVWTGNANTRSITGLRRYHKEYQFRLKMSYGIITQRVTKIREQNGKVAKLLVNNTTRWDVDAASWNSKWSKLYNPQLICLNQAPPRKKKTINQLLGKRKEGEMTNILRAYIVRHVIKHQRHMQSLLHSTVVVRITQGA